MSANFLQAFPKECIKKKQKTKPASHSTCSELRQVQHPLSGTSHSLQIPESPKSRRARRGQATRRTGDVSRCALLRSVEEADGPGQSIQMGGRTPSPSLTPSWLLSPDAQPCGGPCQLPSPSAPLVPNAHSPGLSSGHHRQGCFSTALPTARLSHLLLKYLP